MKQIFITDLKPTDNVSDGIFRIVSYDKQTGKNGNSYIKVGLQDKTGKLEGKIWDNNMPFCAEAKPGDVVRLNGTMNVFNNTLQLIISRMVIENDYDIADFIQTSSRSGEEIFQDIAAYIHAMHSEHLKRFLQQTFADEEFRKKFITFPAGKSIHHAYIGGLAEHVLDMLQMSEQILANHPQANRDIVQTGVILHDIGKLVEFEETNMVFDYSLTGKMLGHIFLGALWFNTHIPEDFPEDLKLRITHIILSHHGSLEFGSPVTPKTYEAVIVNKLDDTSYMLNTLFNVQKQYDGVNDFSERLLSLNNDSLYLRPFAG